MIGILREIDAELRQDLNYRWDILEPLEIMGLDRFEDSAVIIRTRLKTRPGQQWRLVGTDFDELDSGDTALVTVDYVMTDDEGATSASTA